MEKCYCDESEDPISVFFDPFIGGKTQGFSSMAKIFSPRAPVDAIQARHSQRHLRANMSPDKANGTLGSLNMSSSRYVIAFVLKTSMKFWHPWFDRTSAANCDSKDEYDIDSHSRLDSKY